MPSTPSLQDVLQSAVPFALPLRRTFRGVDVREGVLIKGPSGWGEFAPFDDYPDRAAARWLASAVEASFGEWPVPLRDEIAVNAIIPAVSSADAAGLARSAILEQGCHTIKVKVGSAALSEDEARVATVRDVLDTVLGRGVGVIRIDANGAWDVERGAVALRRLSAYGIEYVEQPCATREGMRELRSRVDVRFAVDELIRRSDGVVTKVSDFADVAILKPAPLGGVAATVRQAEALDVPVVVSGSLDSSVGLETALAAAAALPDLPFASGLGTGVLLAEDLGEPLVPCEGRIPVRRSGPSLPDLLAARDRLSDERAEYWRQRIARAWAVKE
ncbi:MAG: o-succinylbenzoate synthase [Candidatus Nanopelagicales bacterium]